MNTVVERIKNGVINENPIFVSVLGMCPSLAVTTSAVNGLGMGLSTMVVLIASNAVISLLRGIIPNKVRIPAFIVIIASFVTIIDMLLQAYSPGLYSALGIFIPLIVVNCIVLGRAEAYAYQSSVFSSVFDGVGMGLGFTFALFVIGAIRELFGIGTLFGVQLMPDFYEPVSILVLAPGAFFVMGLLFAIYNHLMSRQKNKKGGEA